MITKIKIWIALLIFSLAYMPVYSQETPGKFIGSGNKLISYMGRIGMTDSCAEIYWTGSSVTINVAAANSVKALLADETGNNYYYVIVDGDGSKATKIKIDKEKKFYTLAANLTIIKHSIELFKLTNTDLITTRFYGFEIDSAAQIVETEVNPKRKIEFFGNSITCGHGAEDNSNNSGAPEFFNNYRAYGAVTARHFNAQYHCTSKSGIGITVSWFPEVMPDIYNRLNPKDSNSRWDFSQYIPDIVVVNLFQNDSWLVNMPEHPQFKARFGSSKPSESYIIESYKSFIQSIRNKYPKAHIICCLGNMDATKEGSKWPAYIDSAVASLKDHNIVTHFFSYKNTPGHPGIKEQEAMAKELIAFIEKEKYW